MEIELQTDGDNGFAGESSDAFAGDAARAACIGAVVWELTIRDDGNQGTGMTRFRSDMARKMTSLLVEIAQRTGHELDQSLVQSRLDEVMLGGNQEKIDEFFDVVLEDLRSVAQGVGNPELVALVTEFEIERERE